MHQQLCTHCGTLPILRHWSSRKNVAFSHCSLVMLHAACVRMQKSHSGWCSAFVCAAVLACAWLISSSLCVSFAFGPTGTEAHYWIKTSTSGPGRRSVGGRWDSVQHRSATPCLVDLANQPPQKCLICWPARGMKISTPCAQALRLSGSLFLHLVLLRDPTLCLLLWCHSQLLTCSISLFGLTLLFQ